MSETNPPRRVGRSIVAVLVGMVVGIVATIAPTFVLRQIGVFPPWGASMVGYDGALDLRLSTAPSTGSRQATFIARLAPDSRCSTPWWAGSWALSWALWVPRLLGTKDRFRASLVSPCAHRASDAAGLVGGQLYVVQSRAHHQHDGQTNAGEQR